MKKLLFLAALIGCQTKPKPKPVPPPPTTPDLPTPGPKRKPAIVWLNGTNARCSNYARAISYMKRQGYEVECPESRNTGNGRECLQEIDKLWARGYRHIGVAGHSQGGGGSFACAYRAERKYNAEFPVIGVEPAHGMNLVGGVQRVYPQIKSPSFQWHGSRDTIVSKRWVSTGYRALEAEKYWLEATGARHIPTPTTWINESIVFFDWKLKGESDAAFKGLVNKRTWSNP